MWNQGTELDPEAAERLRSLLGRKLTVDDAVQIAMLNNRDLQAMYSELGIAQADLVQAGLFRNPILDAAVLVSTVGRPAGYSARRGLRPAGRAVRSASQTCGRRPVRGGEASCHRCRARLRREVRHAFYAHQANEQMLELRPTVVQALEASVEVSRRLHKAGNITDLDLARDRAALARSKLELRSAEVAVRQSRERLNGLMGLSGAETEWHIERRLPDVPPNRCPSTMSSGSR